MYFFLVKKLIEIINLIFENNKSYSSELNNDNQFEYDNNLLKQFLLKEYGYSNCIIENYNENISLMEINNIYIMIIVRQEMNFIDLFVSPFDNKEKAIKYIQELEE